jgi:hypothetical protein
VVWTYIDGDLDLDSDGADRMSKFIVSKLERRLTLSDLMHDRVSVNDNRSEGKNVPGDFEKCQIIPKGLDQVVPQRGDGEGHMQRV